MPIDPTNPPNYVTDPNAAIPVYVVGSLPTGGVSQIVAGDNIIINPSAGTGTVTISAIQGGGATLSYYLNGGTTSTPSGYKQLSTTAVVGTNTDFTASSDGLIASFITDVGQPNITTLPAGNWNFTMYFSSSSSGGSPSFYVQLLKYNGTTFTAICDSSLTPESITGGTSTDLYYTSLAVPQTTLSSTDRLAIKVFVTTSGRTLTLHTQGTHLCVAYTNITTTPTGIQGSGTTNYLSKFTSGSVISSSQVFDDGTNVGIGTALPAEKLDVAGKVKTTGGVLQRVTQAATYSASPLSGAWNSSTTDLVSITAQTGSITFGADAGSASVTNGQKIIFRVVAGSGGCTVTFDTGANYKFRAIGVTLPTSQALTVGQTLMVGAIYNSNNSYWEVVAVSLG